MIKKVKCKELAELVLSNPVSWRTNACGFDEFSRDHGCAAGMAQCIYSVWGSSFRSGVTFANDKAKTPAGAARNLWNLGEEYGEKWNEEESCD